MEILPSEEFWKKVGFEEPRKIIGNINGPKSREGLSGWTQTELKEILTYCGEEKIYAKNLTRKALLGNIQRKAVKSLRLMALLTKYSKTFSITAIRKVASSADLDYLGLTKKSIVLRLFLKKEDLLVNAYYLSLIAGKQTVHSYTTDSVINKATITSKSYRSKMLEELKKAPSMIDKEIEIKRVDTKREDPLVTFYIRHERGKQYISLMNEKESHWDKPTRWSTVSINTKSGGLEVTTSIRKLLDDIVSIIGEITFKDKSSFFPLSKRTQFLEGLQPFQKEFILESQTLISIEAENVGITGTPNIRVEGIDIVPTIEYLRKYKELDLTKNIVGWEIQVSIRQNGIRRVMKVIKPKDKTGKRTDFTFEPKMVSHEVKEYVYALYSNGLIPNVP